MDETPTHDSQKPSKTLDNSPRNIRKNQGQNFLENSLVTTGEISNTSPKCSKKFSPYKSPAGHPKEASIYTSDGKFQGRAPPQSPKDSKRKNAKNFTSKIINSQETINATNLPNYQQQQPQLPFTTHRLPQDPSKRVKMVDFNEENFTCNSGPEITITYSGNTLQNNITPTYTNAKPAHPSTTGNSNYNPREDSGPNIAPNNPPNVENDHKNKKNPLQESQVESYIPTTQNNKNSEAITVATQMQRTTLLNLLNTGRYVSPEERRRIHNAIEAIANESSSNAFSEIFPELSAQNQQKQTNADDSSHATKQPASNYNSRALEQAIAATINAINPPAEELYTQTIRNSGSPNESKNSHPQSYSQATFSRSPTTQVVSKIHKLRIVPPLRKEHFSNNNTLEAEITRAYKDILTAFSPNIRNLITISRTNVKVANKTYQVLQVIAPESAEPDITRMKLNGLTIMGRTVFPTSEDFWQVRNSFYPKTPTIRISNVPVLCDDDALIEALQFPSFLEFGLKERETKQTEIGPVHTGKTAIQIKINSEDEEAEMRSWSFHKAYTCPAEWLGVEIPASIPKLHICKKCKEEKISQFRGHEEEWCRIRRTPLTPPVSEITEGASTSVMPEERNKAQLQSVEAPGAENIRSEDRQIDSDNPDEDDSSDNQDDNWQTVQKKGQKRTKKQPSEASKNSRNSSPVKEPTAKQAALQPICINNKPNPQKTVNNDT